MYERILVPVDGSTTSTKGLHEAIKLARGHQAKLRLVCIANDPNVALAEAAYPSAELWQRVREDCEAVLAQAKQPVVAAGLAVEACLLEAPTNVVGELIVEQAEQWPADLIVMGTHGRRGIGRLLLGSAAEFVLRRVSVPVLLVRDAS